jgi:hypothetical protein
MPPRHAKRQARGGDAGGSQASSSSPTLAASGDRSDLESTLEYEHNAIIQSNKAAI